MKSLKKDMDWIMYEIYIKKELRKIKLNLKNER